MKSKNSAGNQDPAPLEIPPTGEAKAQNAPSLADIQQRAYEIHLERGGGHGEDLADWLQAERELQAKHQAG